MTFSFRLFAGFLIVISVAVYLFFTTAMIQIELAIAQAAEETMVDTANLLAELVEEDFKAAQFNGFYAGFDDYKRRAVSARIFKVIKETPSFRVYITDADGTVMFDSEGSDVGQDYSNWNDVYLTLRGRYGARTTASNPDDEDTAVLHVAAPVMVDGDIVGVLTVAKSRFSLTGYREEIRLALLQSGAFLLIVTLLVAVALSWWFTRSVRRLQEYALAVSGDVSGEASISIPTIKEPELDELGQAMARMRASLEGKAYVEDYIRGLTHELKSPISAIRGALELLEGPMSDTQRERFLGNISHETRRLEEITTRLLELAQLEHQREPGSDEPCDLLELAREIHQSLKPLADENLVVIEVTGSSLVVQGDRFLLTQALENLVRNALRWCPLESVIRISVEDNSLSVHDEGPGVPEYALERLCERFFSLPDPLSGKKSSGLGLSFVRQIMLLHGGDVSFHNEPTDQDDGGFKAVLKFPAV